MSESFLLGVGWLAVLGCAGLAALVCLYADRLGYRLGVIDKPDGRRKLHEHATPLTGGFAVMGPTLALFALLALLTPYTPLYLTMLAAGLCCLFLGLLDDRRHIRPLWRLSASLATCIAVLLVAPGLKLTFFNFSFLDHALFLDGWALLFTLFCLVGLQNAVNMADGKNGLVIGLSLIWTIALMEFAPEHLLPVLLGLFAALGVTFVFNLKGRLFLGDSGAYAIAMAVGLLAIYTYNVSFARLPADLMALWFLVPVVDCLRLMVLRVARGRSPFAADRNHLHHILARWMPWRWGLVAYLALVAVPAFAAAAQPDTTMAWALAVLSLYAVIIAVALRLSAVAPVATN